MLRTIAIGLAAASLMLAPGRAGIRLEVFNDGRAEYLEVVNETPASLDLDAFIVVSLEGGQRYVIRDLTLPAGQSVRITSGDTPATAADIAWTRQNVWNNGGDTAALYSPTGELVTSKSYGRTKGIAPSVISALKGTGVRR